MSHYLKKLQSKLSPGVLFPQKPLIRFAPNQDFCPECNAVSHVWKTHTREVATLRIGHFIAHETQTYCPRCADQSVFPAEELQQLVSPGARYGYDVIAFIGQAIFLHCRNGKEIQQELQAQNITISLREIDYLGRRFIVYLALAHAQSQEKIKQFMGTQGGYILHLDGTCEGDSPHLMCTIDALSQIVLDNIKIPTENTGQLIPFLRRILQTYGEPIALVHDMGVAILKAVAAVFPNAPDFICHFHFLKDIGKDLLGHDYHTLRRHLKTHRIRSHLRATAKAIKQAIEDAPDAGQCLDHYLQSTQLEEPDTPLRPLVAAYLIITWVVEAKSQSNGFGFPFDRPHLDFYLRLQEAAPKLNALQQKMGADAALLPLMRISKTLADRALSSTVSRMLDAVRVFEQLRGVMRIAQPDSREGLNDEGDADMATIKARLTQFRHCEEIKNLAAMTLAYRKMIRQIDKYWDKLFADPIQVATKTGFAFIQPQRTNNILEQFFRCLKRNGRKRSGNHALSKTLKTMLAQTPLVKNLENPPYMEILLNGKADLAERFAEIDIVEVRKAFEDAQRVTQKYPKRMAEVFKIPNLPQRLLEMPQKKPAGSKSNRILRP
ncbi:MAG: transposase [Patescibacteria group bacterium]|nr:transposase [Patescibacteria group bacterium]